MFELKPGQGTLHRVVDKQGNGQRPDYTGQLNVDGTVFRVSGWIKISKNGDKWLSLNCELPRQKAVLETPPAKVAKPAILGRPINPDDDIPF